MRARTLGALAIAGALLAVASCDGSGSDQGERTVTLYSSVDDALLTEIVELCRERTGVRVLVVGDTEATKTTGLVQRLIAEQGSPRADVWWSSEPFGTILLSREGVLAPYSSEAAESHFERGWPETLRGEHDDWYAFAQRARVIAYSTDRVPEPPASLAALTDPAWKGRVGMARPGFGTTRGHMGALLDLWGEQRFVAWLRAMKANGVRLYDGNASAVRAVAHAEIDACLTDTDDVWSAQRNGWPVGAGYERLDDALVWPSPGAMVIPNTVALVAGGPNPDTGAALIDFLLSPEVETAIARTDSGNVPVIPGAEPAEGRQIPSPWRPDLERVASKVRRAVELCREHLE